MIVALLVTAIIVVALVVIVVAARRRRRPTDDIASFRRQIDALSPEARRQTSDRMKPSERAPNGDDGADDT